MGIGSPRATLLLTASLLVPAGPGRAEGGDVRAGQPAFRALREQGVHYYRKGFFEPARGALERAAALPEGDTDFRTHYYLARTCYELLVLEDAFPAARRAVELSAKESHRRRAQGLLDRLEQSFGGVTLHQAPEQEGQVARGIIHLADAGGLIQPKKKELFRRIRAHFRSSAVELPLTIYLPFGSYTANLAPFEIERGKTAEATTFLVTRAERDRTWIWVAGGSVAAAALATTAAVLLLTADDPERAVRVSSIPLRP